MKTESQIFFQLNGFRRVGGKEWLFFYLLLFVKTCKQLCNFFFFYIFFESRKTMGNFALSLFMLQTDVIHYFKFENRKVISYKGLLRRWRKRRMDAFIVYTSMKYGKVYFIKSYDNLTKGFFLTFNHSKTYREYLIKTRFSVILFVFVTRSYVIDACWIWSIQHNDIISISSYWRRVHGGIHELNWILVWIECMYIN